MGDLVTQRAAQGTIAGGGNPNPVEASPWAVDRPGESLVLVVGNPHVDGRRPDAGRKLLSQPLQGGLLAISLGLSKHGLGHRLIRREDREITAGLKPRGKTSGREADHQ